jgi:hypothetical protein
LEWFTLEKGMVMDDKKISIGFFDEAEGVKSSTRLNSFILLLFFCVFNMYYIISKDCALGFDFTFFDSMLLIGVFAPKYLQKIAELRFGDNPKKQ